MATLADLRNQKARVTVNYKGLSIWVDYAVQSLTFEVQAEVDKYREEKEFDRLAPILCRLILAWDITDEEGRRVPVTIENMRTIVGMPLAIEIWQSVQRDMFDPNPGESSGNGSATAGLPGSVPVPIGTNGSSAPVSTISTPPITSGSGTPAPVFAGIDGP